MVCYTVITYIKNMFAEKVFTYKSYNIIQFTNDVFYTCYVSRLDGELKEIRTKTLESAKKQLDLLVYGIEK